MGDIYGMILVGILFPAFAIGFTVGLQIFMAFAKAYRDKVIKNIDKYSGR